MSATKSGCDAKWNASAPLTHVSSVLRAVKAIPIETMEKEEESDWVRVEVSVDSSDWERIKEGSHAHGIAPETAAEESKEWQNVEVEPSPDKERTQMETCPKVPSSLEGEMSTEDVSQLADKVATLRDVQHELVKIVAALHQRMAAFEQRDKEKDEQIANLRSRVVDLDRNLATPVDDSGGAVVRAARLDAFLADAMRAEHRRIFG